MIYLKRAIDLALALICVYMVYNGVLMFVATNGEVQGSEFGMLITLVNQLSVVMVWMALFAIRTTVHSIRKNEQA